MMSSAEVASVIKNLDRIEQKGGSKNMSMNEIINAVELIKQFLDSGDGLTTAEWETEDGTILRCDWGYFLEGLYEIEGYAVKHGGEVPEHREWRNWNDSEFNSCFGKEQEHETAK